MKQLPSLAMLLALVAALQGSASASTTYRLTVINNSSAPVEFQVYQSDPGTSGFRASSARQICIQPKHTATDAVEMPAGITVQTKQTKFELVFTFKDSSCAGQTISRKHLLLSDPHGTYFIHYANGLYTITH